MFKYLSIAAAILMIGSQAIASEKMETYNELYRPQFHFSPKENWMNDPNGLIYYDGEYHLFFQYLPAHISNSYLKWWGHAVSNDLVHWKQIEPAIKPYDNGGAWSGSTVIDKDNTSGLQTGKEKVMLAFYTLAPQDGRPFTQHMSYSNDRGRTWTVYDKNPVISFIKGLNRDAKVFWHEPTKKWVLVIYLDVNDYGCFTSTNLKDWTRVNDITMPGCFECPDIFEMPIDGNKNNKKWVFVGGNGHYMIGNFDGTKFTCESGPFQSDYGRNYYATQTFNNIPESDGRRIQITWMAEGNYPDMPFNQQMNFPTEMTLHSTPEGLRIYRLPVREICKLYKKEHKWSKVTLNPGDNLLKDVSGDLFDISAEFYAKSAPEFGIKCRGEAISYDVKNGKLSCLGKSVDVAPVNGKIKLRVLLDRSSIEVYANEGKVVMTSCFLPKTEDKSLAVYSNDGFTYVRSLKVYELKSSWKND